MTIDVSQLSFHQLTRLADACLVELGRRTRYDLVASNLKYARWHVASVRKFTRNWCDWHGPVPGVDPDKDRSANEEP